MLAITLGVQRGLLVELMKDYLGVCSRLRIEEAVFVRYLGNGSVGAMVPLFISLNRFSIFSTLKKDSRLC